MYGERFLRWAYGNPLGRLTVALVVKRRWFSRWYGRRMNRPASRSKIEPFIREYGVDTEEFAEPVENFKTFNEFFYRRLKPDARPVAPGEKTAVFPADGRHLAIPDVSLAEGVFVKGQCFDLAALLDGETEAFAGGSALISRLCPVDYHRYHFPVSGRAGSPRAAGASLRSVNPLALRRRISILWENRRMITAIDSDAFGKVAVVEVGATCVGGLHPTFSPGRVEKGDEKGYFSFGGSCVVTIFQRGAICFDEGLVQRSAEGREVYAKMGDRCGSAVVEESG
ncbi:MAG: phosphatidylserine decarboxylase [Opitutales bacterium]